MKRIYLVATNYRDLKLLHSENIKYVLISAGTLWNGYKFNIKPIVMAKKHGFSLIIDSGAQQFLAKLDHYPRSYKSSYIQLDKLLDENDFIATLDVPLDILSETKWEWAIKESIENAIWMHDKVKNAHILTVVQGHESRPQLFEHSYNAIIKHIDPKHVGIGSVCMARVENVIKICRRMRRLVGAKRYLHAFGPDMRTVPRIFNYVNSIDTSMWFKVRSGRYGLNPCRGLAPPSAKLTYHYRLKELKKFIRKYTPFLW